MDSVQVTLTTAPVSAKVPATSPIPEEMDKLRAELSAALEALKQKSALCEQLFAKTIEQGKKEKRAKANLPAKNQLSPARRLAASVRLFKEETGPSGFEYLYLPQNRRMNRSEARTSLRRLGLEPSRLLDIIMPTRKVIGLLVHFQYAPKVREVLAKHGLKPIEFDPTDSTTSPTRSMLPLLRMIESSWPTASMPIYMRPEVPTAVGRYFVDQQWLTLEQFAAARHFPTEVQQILDIAASHSLHLGYRWSPTKYAVLNGPASRQFTLYDETLPTVVEFIYLGVPFQRQGMSTSSLFSYRTPGIIFAMGARPSGFKQLLRARLYRTFIRPKFEYALAISNFGVKEHKDLERIQDRCLRMLFGGHRLSSSTFAIFRP
ncbi:hypothetical protein K450DRAFT_196210 [Umbelopsis ramanniana AG]|uniref:Uncharacterized protein n=1 Tax=Umbelopsis ramanniana AG TaxID=1314678 RepID=A0AAD5EGK2_UMBRA|nr:uncharacterized protein K450DRAFT_196210 [Umbelopsis ramanniana AG]KAI8583446.1 hypothetical protein K450DRAFT_196210 [Umbelopsis ramanniana AG]